MDGLRDFLVGVASVGFQVLIQTGLQREADRLLAGVSSAELRRRVDRVRVAAESGTGEPAALGRVVRAAEGLDPGPALPDFFPGLRAFAGGSVPAPVADAVLRWRLLVAAQSAMQGATAIALVVAPADRATAVRQALAGARAAVDGTHPLDPGRALPALAGG